MKVLIIEDNELLSNNIATYLKLENIESKQIFEWKTAVFELASSNYDLVILDLWLPDISGIEVCEKIRESGKNIPILILTARSNIKDKISGFQSGADDYVIKPFDYEELLVRAQVLVRRNFVVRSKNISLGKKWNITLDLNNKKAFVSGEEMHLSNMEMELLVYLVHNKWKTVSKEELLEKVWWEYNDFQLSRTVDVYVWYLRKKLWKEIIETIRWQWYVIY